MSEQSSTVGLATCRPAYPASPAQSCSQRAFVRAQLPSEPFRPHNSLVLTASLACAARHHRIACRFYAGGFQGLGRSYYRGRSGIPRVCSSSVASSHPGSTRSGRGRALSTPSGMPSTVARPIPRVQEAETPVNRGSTRDGRGPHRWCYWGCGGSSRVCRRQSCLARWVYAGCCSPKMYGVNVPYLSCYLIIFFGI